MFKEIKRWAVMKKTTHHEIGIFNISLTGLANYIGWAVLGFNTLLICLIVFALKVIMF
jgi:hypothetical protein